MTLSITRQFLRAGATALILSTVTSVSMFVSADAVYAERGGNGNSNRGGNSDRNSNRSENGNANRSNNGNANRSNNGNANRAVVQQHTNNAGGNGRGALASELRGLNAAHANQNALENASPNSMPGKLYIYQQEQPELRADAADAQVEYERLSALTAEEIAAEFSEDQYAAALAAVAGDSDELLRLTELTEEQIAEEFSSEEDYGTALEAAAGNSIEFDRLAGLDAETIAAEFPDSDYATTLAGADDAYLEADQSILESLLLLSGNRLLSDEAIAELDRLLGL
jgi:hypothetical protein